MNTKSLSIVCLFAILFIGASSPLQADGLSSVSSEITLSTSPSMHPNVVLRGAKGDPIEDPERMISSIQSCGGCHDVEYIQNHSDHQSLWQQQAGFTVTDYFRFASENRGATDTAAPLQTALSFGDDGSFNDDGACLNCHTNQQQRSDLNLTLLNPKGEISGEQLQISKPKNANCAQCHGIVDTQIHQPLRLGSELHYAQLTLTTGQILSPQKIALSALNIKDRASHTRSFDIHSERLVDCVACHYSQNNPVYTQQHNEQRLEHLTFDPRRPSVGEYLTRPSHKLANTQFDNTSSCQSCHDGEKTHQWLPAYNKHVRTLACESCHIPELFGPTLESIDWRILDDKGMGMPTFRNVADDGLITAFQPQLVQHADSNDMWRPANSITMQYWQYGGQQQPVPSTAVLEAIQALKDASLPVSFPPDEAALTAIKEQLQAQGFTELTSGVQTEVFPLSHGVVSGEWATKDCTSCHSEASLLAANSNRGSYILGRDRIPWIDQLGAVLFLLVIAIVTLHSLLRYKLSPNKSSDTTANEVYMYDRYERLWHWLQAVTIFALLGSGLIIHLPDMFAWMSFSYMVQIHQILGFVLLANALFSLFYHLVSGEIRQYLPKPYGLIHEMMAQGLYYAKGIFKGAPHPFHKTKARKLNPLQQITYFAILNLLLPAQLISGFAIWAGNYWPELTQWLGGSELLLPLHVGLAWLFASFIVMHVYLTTTVGENPTDGIKAMVSGWEQTESGATELDTAPSTTHQAAGTAQPHQGGRS